jgi:TRAP transporter TAXI family solute receptor
MTASRRWLLPLLAGLLLIGLVAAAVFALNSVRPPKRFSIASGAPDGAYYAAAQRMSQALADRGFQADVLITAGSAENLSLLKSGKADFAVVQGGVSQITDTTGLSTVAMVSYEPVWLIFNRSAFNPDVSKLRPDDLVGKRIGIGAPGSGIQPVAREILAGIGVSETNTVFVEEGMSAMAKGLREGKLDAAFFVTVAANPVVQGMIRDPALGLFAPRFADALSRKLPYLNPVTL